ncbi:MAG: hypothetical protein MUD17_09425 [Gemmatimonadaceae bacterium]|nr:hypothetical protein [Gemmatimonadaceae bacterium]
MLVLTRLLVCSATVALAACGAANGLGLGDSARLVAMAYRCLGTIPVAATWQWSVLDTSIVRVDAASGWVVARREGETQVVARGAAPISVSTTARVTVRR